MNKDLPITLEGLEPTELTDFESFVLLSVGVVCTVGLAGVLALVYLAIRWVVS